MYNQSDLLEMLRNLRREPNDQEQPIEDASIENSLCLNSYEVIDEANNSNISSSEQTSKDDYLFPNNGRASTAPVKAVEEEFKWSTQFNNLEKAVFLCNRLIIRQDNKFDVDSDEGLEICKKFMEQLENLIKSLKVNTASREYRKNFSRAYKYLYKDGSLCYLTEILDSAQESIQCLWVNGEKYCFSKEVLDCGNKLYSAFCEALLLLKNSYTKCCEDSFFENIKQIKLELKTKLEEFDTIWVTYEQKYINELIFIENESRRLIKNSIEIEKELTSFEVRAKCRGKVLIDSEEYNKMRNKLVLLISEINRVANIEGKGRDDLNLEILLEAEGIMRRISSNQCKAVRFLAEKIKQSFMSIRILLRKYEENIEIVDPQLKNNPDLVECLFNFENTWEKGKEFLLNQEKCQQLINFSQLIEILCEKYKELNEQLETRDPNIFVWIPSVVILKSIEKDDKGICMEFNPNMFNKEDESGKLFKELKQLYFLIAKDYDDSYSLYNMLEKSILFDDLQDFPKTNKNYLYEFDKKIKILAMQLQRLKPSEWNNFIDLAMNQN